METAKEILKKKGLFKREMDSQLGRERSEMLWERAEVRLEEILRDHASIPKGHHTHTDRFIFPAAAVYLTLKEAEGAQRAIHILEDPIITSSEEIGRRLGRLMRIPGMRSLFIWLWDPVSRRMFGESCGFRNVFYPRKKGEYRMDIVACPYDHYFRELGCPELTRIFCENDERTYGNLPGLVFARKTTLGKGGERCDFCLRKGK